MANSMLLCERGTVDRLTPALAGAPQELMGVRVPDVSLELLAVGAVVRLGGVLPGVPDAVLAGHGHGGRGLVHRRGPDAGVAVAHRLSS